LYTNSTLKGLDDALRDLERAIKALPEGPMRKKLTQRFFRLQKVQEGLTHPVRAQQENYNLIILLLFGIFVITFLLYISLRGIKK